MVHIPRPRRRSVVLIGAGAAAAALLSAGVAVAASGPSAHATAAPRAGTHPTGAPQAGGRPGNSGAHPGSGGPGWSGTGGGPGGFGGGFGGMDVLHSVAVRSLGTGTETDDFQSGTVTAVSATALTVRSTDGFVASYVLNSATHEFGAGQTTAAPTLQEKVTVSAVQASDGTKTAKDVSAARTPPAARPAPTASAAG